MYRDIASGKFKYKQRVHANPGRKSICRLSSNISTIKAEGF